jgi:hypothetical protein
MFLFSVLLLLFLWLLFIILIRLRKSLSNGYIIFDLVHQLMKWIIFHRLLILRYHPYLWLIAFLFFVYYQFHIIRFSGLLALASLEWLIKQWSIRSLSIFVYDVNYRSREQLFRWGIPQGGTLAPLLEIEWQLNRCLFGWGLLLHLFHRLRRYLVIIFDLCSSSLEEPVLESEGRALQNIDIVLVGPELLSN